MAKHWRAVKDEIEEEIDRIWWQEPEEITMSRLGIFPSGAGTDGQVLGNLLFLLLLQKELKSRIQEKNKNNKKKKKNLLKCL